MNIHERLKRLEDALTPELDPAAALAECDPLSQALFVAEAYGILGDTKPGPQAKKILQYIRQHPEQFPPMPSLDEILSDM